MTPTDVRITCGILFFIVLAILIWRRNTKSED